MNREIEEEKAFEYLADMIVLDHVENFEKTSDIIRNEIIKSIKDDIKAIKILLAFMDSIKEKASFISFDNETEEVIVITNEDVRVFLDKLGNAYKILLDMLEENKKDFENMEF